MEAKEVVQRAYDLFGAGDMEGFMNEIVHDDVTWTFSGEEGKHPLVGVCLLYTSPSPRDRTRSRMPSSA